MGDRRGLLVAICVSVLATGASARVSRRAPADAPAYLGLPECLDRAYQNDPDYILYGFHNDSHSFIVPLSDEIDVTRNGKPLQDGSAAESEILEAVFPSRHYVYVPATGRITSRKDPGNGVVYWTFPEGTSFIHEVYEDPKGSGSDFSDLLEVRVERMIGGRFRFGVYDPNGTSCPAGSLELRTRPVLTSTRVAAPRSSFGNVSVRFQPLAPDSCLDCHSMEATSVQTIQPCAFEDPANASMTTIHADIPRWVSDYKKRFGHSPLAAQFVNPVK